MEARNTTQHVVSRTGAERQGHIFSFQSREKNVLDLSSYRSGYFNNYPSSLCKIDHFSSSDCPIISAMRDSKPSLKQL